MQKKIDVNMGKNGQYKQEANYTYGNEEDPSREKYSTFTRTSDARQASLIEKQDETEKIVEHISEDEKSTSSEEVVFEEWTEEFRCRRTDEYDQRTNQLLRTTIDETSDRIKGDVIKEHYKGKNTRIKGHKSYDVVKEVSRRKPTWISEETHQSPPRASITPTIPSSQNRQWTSEEIYTTEIVQDPNIAKELETTAQKYDATTRYDRVRPSQYSPIPSTTEPTVSTIPSTRYDRISTVVTPTIHYPERRRQEPEEVISEEYHVEFQSPTKREETSRDNLTETFVRADEKTPTRRASDWRIKLKEIYSPPSDDDQVNEHHLLFSFSFVFRREKFE